MSKRNYPCHCGSGKKYKQCHLPIENKASVKKLMQHRKDNPPHRHLQRRRKNEHRINASWGGLLLMAIIFLPFMFTVSVENSDLEALGFSLLGLAAIPLLYGKIKKEAKNNREKGLAILGGVLVVAEYALFGFGIPIWPLMAIFAFLSLFMFSIA